MSKDSMEWLVCRPSNNNDTAHNPLVVYVENALVHSVRMDRIRMFLSGLYTVLSPRKRTLVHTVSDSAFATAIERLSPCNRLAHAYRMETGHRLITAFWQDLIIARRHSLIRGSEEPKDFLLTLPRRPLAAYPAARRADIKHFARVYLDACSISIV
jgi:hypothetical protein